MRFSSFGTFHSMYFFTFTWLKKLNWYSWCFYKIFFFFNKTSFLVLKKSLVKLPPLVKMTLTSLLRPTSQVHKFCPSKYTRKDSFSNEMQYRKRRETLSIYKQNNRSTQCNITNSPQELSIPSSPTHWNSSL